MHTSLNSKHVLLVLFETKMAATVGSVCSFKLVTSTEVNHFLCSFALSRKAPMYFHVEVCCVYFYHCSSARQANLMFVYKELRLHLELSSTT